MIEKAMAEAGVSVKAGKNAKSQVGDRPLICNTSFLIIETQVAETLRLIQSNSTLPIQRARMRVRVIVPEAEGERLQEQLLALAEKVEKEDKGETWETVCVLISCF
jgi:ribosome maturation protein SDO1